MRLKFKRWIHPYRYNNRFEPALSIVAVFLVIGSLYYMIHLKSSELAKVKSDQVVSECLIPPEYHVLRAVGRTDWQVVVPTIDELVSDANMCVAVAKAIKRNEYFINKRKKL